MTGAKQRRSLEEAIVDTVREPLIVLDEAMRVLIASRSFYSAFQVTKQEAEGRSLFELGNGQWNIASLRERLGKIIPDHATIEGFEVEHDFPTLGQRTMVLNARKVFYEGNGSTSLLLAIEDVTERRVLERDKDEFSQRKHGDTCKTRMNGSCRSRRSRSNCTRRRSGRRSRRSHT
jgi:PAS domain S-box-containing protein